MTSDQFAALLSAVEMLTLEKGQPVAEDQMWWSRHPEKHLMD